MAMRTAINDLHPMTTDRIQRARVEALRAQGRHRELVLWLLRCPEPWCLEVNGKFQTRAVRMRPALHEPTRDDLAGALRDESPLPAPIRDYIITRYLLQTTPIKTGRKTPTRSTADDDRVLDVYSRAYLKALDAYEADESAETRDVKRRAAQATANECGISPRTIDGILASRRILKSPPK